LIARHHQTGLSAEVTVMQLSRTTGRHFSRCGPAPSLSSGSLRVGHRYATQEGEVREIVSFDGGLVVYVVGRGHFSRLG
jgi:hypothetical protein